MPAKFSIIPVSATTCKFLEVLLLLTILCNCFWPTLSMTAQTPRGEETVLTHGSNWRGKWGNVTEGQDDRGKSPSFLDSHAVQWILLHVMILLLLANDTSLVFYQVKLTQTNNKTKRAKTDRLYVQYIHQPQINDDGKDSVYGRIQSGMKKSAQRDANTACWL